MSQYEIAIVGAGISGISLAHHCSRSGIRTLLLEKSSRPGGSLHSHEFGGDACGFWLELGAHTCYNSYGGLISILEDCSLLNRLWAREKAPFKLIEDGNIKSIFSSLNFLELATALPKMLFSKKSGKSVEAYYSIIAGTKNYKKVIGPAFDAVISQNASCFPADAIFKKRPRRKDVFRSFTYSGGLGAMAADIADDPGIELLAEHAAESVEYKNGEFIIFVDGKKFTSEFLALACPLPAASMLLKNSFPDISEHLGRINVGKIETLGVLVHKGDLRLPALGGLVAINENYFSAVSRDAVSDEKFRGFAFHFRPGKLSIDEKIKTIAAALKIEPDKIVQTVAKNDNVVPSLTLDHAKWQSEADKLLKGKPLFVTGNYFSGVAIEDCMQRSLSEFNRFRQMVDAAGQSRSKAA